ncbi:CaiB/BaiF CoA-transferase family protein [Hydrogenophaga sp.]|uniref:CaiB/BaiF CoA transferase family protein n=1 Tax=Hydrogenophaga sp. TaxID=1904254 RepID=UPI0027191C68|nr:CoA transferase [Hydrogenophaga sp.]MDO9433969.1 CoA transferase [Hydrogenophaga sp.]
MNDAIESGMDQAPQTDQALLPLSGLTVIDLTLARAGPTAVRHLADWGAEVIRIEPPLAPPGTPANEDVVGKERGSDYQNLHRNKRSLRLNLKDPAGRAVLMDLVRSADVLIENMRPGVKHRLGIAYEDLKPINPRLVYGSISGFGQQGPYRERPGLDQIAQGMSGLMSVTGWPDGPPLRAGTAVADLTSGNMLALNVMMALYERQRTGQGRWVHTSLLESLVFMMDFQATRWLVDKEVPQRVGNEHPTAIPTDVFPSSDGHICVCAASSRMWPRLCATLGHPEWATQPGWETRDSRKIHRKEIHAHIGAVTRTQTSDHWITTMNAGGVTCGPIYGMDEVFADEQVKQLGLAQPVQHPTLGLLHLVASPLNFDGVERRIRSASPEGGRDSAAILGELGYSDDKIHELQTNGVC